MANKKPDSSEYLALKSAVTSGQLARLYIFHGEEKYLLENYLAQIQKRLVGADFADFNYKRFQGNFSVDELIAACDTLPAFAERTMIVVSDFDLFKQNDETKQKLTVLLSDLPDYVCLIFVYDVIEYSPDNRQKQLATALKKDAKVVEFNVQEQSEIVKWIKKHFSANNKKIDTQVAEYLAFITGGLMTTLNVEIEKVSSYTKDVNITKEHIDALVTPVLDVEIFKLTDYIADGDFNGAAAVLFDLMSLREPAHKLMFSISLKLRQLMAARLLYENGLGEKALMDMCDIRFDFHARKLMAGARRTTLDDCRRAVILCGETAFRMNRDSEPENLLTELLLRLAESKRSLRL